MICPVCGNEVEIVDGVCPMCGMVLEAEAEPAATAEPETAEVPEASEPPKPAAAKPRGFRLNYRKLGLGLLAMVAVVALVFSIKTLAGAIRADRNVYVAQAEGTMKVLSDLDEKAGDLTAWEQQKHSADGTDTEALLPRPTVAELGMSGGQSDARLAFFSEDGKYIYYFLNCNSDYGTLCRARLSALSTNGKNERAITEIASNVNVNVTLLDNGKLVFQDRTTALFMYDGKTVTTLSTGAAFYYVEPAGRVIFGESGESGYTLLGIDTAKPKDVHTLAAGIASVYTVLNYDDGIYYLEGEGTYTTLLSCGFKKDPERIEDNVRVWSITEDAMYYSALNSDKISLYDYVTDTSAEDDAGQVEPDLEDYSYMTYTYQQLHTTYEVQEDTTLWTSCTKKTYFFGKAMSKLSYSDVKDFVSKYKERENEDGYFEVTDAVKADLLALAKKHGKGADNEWLEFCFINIEAGKAYDYKTYNADCDNYYASLIRNELREDLKAAEAEYRLMTLYKVSGGEKTVLCDNVLHVIMVGPEAFMYNSVDLVTQTMAIDEIKEAADVNTLFAFNAAGENFLISPENDAWVQLSAEAGEVYGDALSHGNAKLYVLGDKVYLFDPRGPLYYGVLENGKLPALTAIKEMAAFEALQDGTLYILDDYYMNGDDVIGNLCMVTDGTATQLAALVRSGSYCVYADGTAMAFTDGTGGYQLTLIDKLGKSTQVAEGVTVALRPDKDRWLYVANGTLWEYDGTDRTQLRSKCTWIWCLDQEKPVLSW